MKKIILSSLVIGVSAIIIVGGIMAYFSDTAMSEGNTFSTGNADLKIKIPDTGCGSWSDSCPGKTWTGLYPGWSNSYNVYLKNESASLIILKIIPYIKETGSSQDLWENCYMEITWSDNSHSTGRYSLEDWKTNSAIELEPRLNQGQSAGPWVVHFDIPETAGNEIANASIEFNLVFNGIQAGEGEECQANADCEDNNDCTLDECVANICQYTCQDGMPCDDGNANTINDSCAGADGQCQCIGEPIGECVNDSDCYDGDQCTDDMCINNTCQYPAVGDGIPCDDNDACTIEDVCADGMCIGGLPVDCDDNNQCTVDSCDSVLGCLNYPQDGIACDDGIYCNGSDICLAGSCSSHLGDPCPGADGDNDCSESCDEAFDDCTANDPDGSVCDNGLCQNGICQPTCVPTAEICDGIDNDCDGTIDEGNPGGGGYCDTGLQGICATGTINCQGGTLVCVQNEQPQTEVCDGIDNDCDGTIDEGIIIEMCPLTANVLSTACSSGSCQITSCVQGYADSDGIYENGCESAI